MKAVQRNESATVDINYNAIPAYASDTMCKTLIGCIKKMFEDPSIQDDYKRWKEDRLKRKEVTP